MKSLFGSLIPIRFIFLNPQKIEWLSPGFLPILSVALPILLSIISFSAAAQQNLFNIPSADITNPQKLFYQHQINLYNYKVESKMHFIYGLGKGWDAGLNIVGKGAYFSPAWRISYNDDPGRGALYPIVLATIQKQFVLSEHVDLNIGSQFGVNISNRLKNKELNHFNYGIGVFHFNDHRGKIIGGVYKTNRMYVGQGNTFGFMAGYEVRVSKRWYVMGDWVSGSNDASVAVLGGTYNLTKRVQLCAGWQFPDPGTPKPAGPECELNLLV